MAFKRSWVRFPSAPPPFALEQLQSFGWQATYSHRSFSNRNAFPERRVSPEALAKGDSQQVRLPSFFALEFSRASGGKPFFRATTRWGETSVESEGCLPKPPPSPRLRRIFPEVLTKGNWRRGTIMKYVYLLQSLSVPTQRYVGVTSNLKERLGAHNAGASSHTSKYRPWKVITYLCFENDRRAAEFERYLKTGSGQAFANKRLW
jgi:putative endonuclease